LAETCLFDLNLERQLSGSRHSFSIWQLPVYALRYYDEKGYIIENPAAMTDPDVRDCVMVLMTNADGLEHRCPVPVQEIISVDGVSLGGRGSSMPSSGI